MNWPLVDVSEVGRVGYMLGISWRRFVHGLLSFAYSMPGACPNRSDLHQRRMFTNTNVLRRIPTDLELCMLYPL